MSSRPAATVTWATAWVNDVAADGAGRRRHRRQRRVLVDRHGQQGEPARTAGERRPREPSVATSTGLPGRAREMSASSRPETSTVPGVGDLGRHLDPGGDLVVEARQPSATPSASASQQQSGEHRHRRPASAGPRHPGHRFGQDVTFDAELHGDRLSVPGEPGAPSCRHPVRPHDSTRGRAGAGSTQSLGAVPIRRSSRIGLSVWVVHEPDGVIEKFVSLHGCGSCGQPGVGAGQARCRAVDRLSMATMHPGTGGGRRSVLHARPVRCSPRGRLRSTVAREMSTAVHSCVHGLILTVREPRARLCPQGCPHVVYEACLIVSSVSPRARLATRRYVGSLGDAWGDPGASGRSSPATTGRLAEREPAGRRVDRVLRAPAGSRMRSVSTGRKRDGRAKPDGFAERDGPGERQRPRVRARGGPAQPREVCLIRLVSSVTWL